MAANRRQLARWNRLLKALRGGGRVTAASLAKENGVSVRTIQRDLDALRDDFGARVEYDPGLHSLRLVGEGHRLMGIELSEAELFHLVVGAGMAAQFDGTPIAASLARLFRKLKDVLDPPCDLDPALSKDWIRFHGWPTRPTREDVWAELVRGARWFRVVSIHYRAAGHRDAVWIDVEPVHLSCNRGDWYLRARRAGGHTLRTYALSRVLKARPTPATFTPREEGRSAEERPLFSRFRNSIGPIRVKVRFTPEAAEWVRERVWHPEQELCEHRDGGLTLTLPIDGDKEAMAWVLRWGPSGRILAPAWLKHQVLEAVTAMKEALR
ncbi:MAG: transcriptional regulator [Planctomycetes bacterium]|nr:transcriptional regulator [Planctomycetota bacterium]MBL7008966.1 transcriptional regulator [Planctomycetota bacterium]